MDRLDILQVFVRVAETGSFTNAADALQMPRSTVSTVVRQLEGRLGVSLLNRTTRRVSMTPDGAALYQRSLRLIADFEQTETLFRQGASRPRGKLRIDVPGRIARRVIVPALLDFFTRYPEIVLDLGATDRAVDLVEEGLDCAIRVGERDHSNLLAEPLGHLELINFASPDYLAKHGTPQSIADLSSHLAVNDASSFTERIEDWEYLEAGVRKPLPCAAWSRSTMRNAISPAASRGSA